MALMPELSPAWPQVSESAHMAHGYPTSPLSLTFGPKVVGNKRLGYLLMDLAQGGNAISILGRLSAGRREWGHQLATGSP